jgi:tetratricopeptide (TPR) repeat protein
MNHNILRLCIGVSLVAVSCPSLAQEEDPAALEELDRAKAAQSATVEVQGAAELRGAMLRIARRPTDSDALVDAGNAALLLGDANAALNFFTRADALQPSNGRIKLGLAVATVRTENPFEALRLFDEAIRLGIPERAVAADRALAFDLLGNFGRAQQDYIIAKQSDGSNRLIVQQAISIALLGNEREADAMLVPLLQQNYGEAWRARAFLLAARGDYKESVKVTQGFMDVRSAQQFERYLRQMPQLTAAQKAAAIHLGHFPANNIGRDSDTLQRVAGNYPSSGPSGAGRLVPTGDPLGPKAGAQTKNVAKLSRRERERAAKRAAQEVQVPAAIARPVSEVADLGVRVPLPIDVARTRILEAEKASFALVAVMPRIAAPVIVYKPAAPVTAQNDNTVPAPTIAASPPAAPPVTPSTAPIVFAQNDPVQAELPAIKTVVPIPTIVGAVPQGNSSIVAAVPGPIASTPPAIAPDIVQANIPQTDTAPPINNLPSETQSAVPQNSGSVPAVSNYQDSSGDPVSPANVATVDIQPSIALPPTQPSTAPVTTTTVAAPMFDLGAVVNAIDIPDEEKKRDIVPVDLKKLPVAAPKAKEIAPVDDKKAKVAAKQAPPTKPSDINTTPRIWVQVATGDAGSFSSDMRIFRRKYAELFKGKEGWVSPWGKQNRLLIGPFDDMKVAKKWEADFRKAGGDGFVWRSEKGVEVKPLKTK